VVSFTTQNNKPAVVVLDSHPGNSDQAWHQLHEGCSFSCFDDLEDAQAFAQPRLVAAWFVAAQWLDCAVELVRLRQFVVIMDDEHNEANEIAAYQAGAMYVCRPLQHEWVSALFGIPSAVARNANCVVAAGM